LQFGTVFWGRVLGADMDVMLIPVSIFQYLFEPMPWGVSVLFDVAVFLENCLCAWLIWKMMSGLRTAKNDERKILLFLFVLYMILETIWSLGTINWGTAMRYHLPSMGILVLAAFFSAGFEKKNSAKLNSSKVQVV
jgi:hypothetical protein